MKRFKFNMVEIALAVAVISIGLSAVMVLFPVGINATRAAMDENICNDAAEYITRYIRGKFLSEWHQPTQHHKHDISGFYANSDTPPASPAPTESGWSAVTGWTETYSGSGDQKDTSATSGLYNLSGSGNEGLYKFVKTGYNGEEIFSAIIKVWMPGDLGSDRDGAPAELQTAYTTTSAASPLYIPKLLKNTQPSLVLPNDVAFIDDEDKTVRFGSIIKSVMVEISWPADAAADVREQNKRVFRVDVCNPYHDWQGDTPSGS